MRAAGAPVLAAFTVATVLAVAAPPAAVAGSTTLQPGDPVQGTGQCTLGYVLHDEETTYFSLAGHCVEVGDRPTGADGTVIGEVVYDDDVADVALIAVADRVEPIVEPAVRGHPDAPTGIARPDDVGSGDTLRVSGHGLGIPVLSFAREQRAGVLQDVGTVGYCADLPAVFGDSGGPVLHEPTGGALGLVNRLGGRCPTSGITVGAIVDRARLDGFDLALSTP